MSTIAGNYQPDYDLSAGIIILSFWNMMSQEKDYSTISPSAKSLLLMKGYTNIPYAKETAALVDGSEVFDLSFDDKDFWFWMRVMHFESRYLSIDQLLAETNNRYILELSSGYSLRGAPSVPQKGRNILHRY